MSISKKASKYFAENQGKTKEEAIKDLMAMGYKQSSAISLYANRNANVINKKQLVFNFFKTNPQALENDNKKYIKQLGIATTTFATYKSLYKMELQKLKLISEPKKPIEINTRYYNNRLRMKFEFDDSRLFG